MSIICLNTFKESGRIVEIYREADRNEWSFDGLKERIRARFGEDMPKFVETAWLKKSTEPYRFGCAHNVRYRSVRSRYWNKPMPFPMDMAEDVDCIGRDVERGGSDPCAWIDHKYKVTLNHILKRRGKPLTIHTRSDLIAHDDYIEALDKDRHTVIFYLLDAVESVVRDQEPGAPSNQRRMTAIDKLTSHGIRVKVIHVPASVIKKNRGAV